MKHLLLTTIAAVLVSCDWGPSTIHQAAYQGNNEAVKRYLEAGTDVSAKNKSGDRESTPLHYAAVRGHKETAELLIAEGADMNANSDNGETPLDLAIQSISFPKGHPETADLLREYGAKTGKEIKAERRAQSLPFP